MQSHAEAQAGFFLTAEVLENLISIYEHGQYLGNQPGVIAKVGDSMTASRLFLVPLGQGQLVFDAYGELEPAWRFFTSTMIEDENPFVRQSLAAANGWTVADVLNPRHAENLACQVFPEDPPLICEYRLIRPSIALIMFGSNDLHKSIRPDFARDLRLVVEMSMQWGVIPILSTIPEQPNRAHPSQTAVVNEIIRQIAADNLLPVWDYHAALADLPNLGLSLDYIHPSEPLNHQTGDFSPENLIYGYTVRNLMALQILDVLWREVMLRPSGPAE